MADMRKIAGSPLLHIALLAVIAGYFFFFRLGDLPLTDPDETFYAQTAKEMLARNDWFTPYLYGDPQFEKPIFFYRLVAFSFLVFGVNEFAARLPSAAFGFLGLLAVYLFGSLFFTRRAGLIAAVILATSVEYLILARACVTDMVLAVFIAFGFLFFFYGYLRKKRYPYIVASVFFALATLTKGPIGLLLPGVVLVIFLIVMKDLKRIATMPLIGCVAAFILTAFPWYIVAYKLHGRAFIDAFFGFQNVTRFLESEHKIGSQWYYNIPVVLGGLFPWSAFLPLGLWLAVKKAFAGASPERGHYRFLIAWFLTIFLFFSVSSTKLPTYIFPCFAALALMIAAAWDSFLTGAVTEGLKRGMRYSYYLLVAAVVGGIIGLYFVIKLKYAVILQDAIVAGAFLAFGFILSLAAFLKRRHALAFGGIVFAVVIFVYPLVLLVIPEIGRFESSKEMAGKLAGLMGPADRVGTESNYRAGVAFYADVFPVDLDRHPALIDIVNAPGRTWAVIKEKNHRQLYDPAINVTPMKTSYMIYRLGKKCIVTNTLPADGRYLMKRETAR